MKHYIYHYNHINKAYIDKALATESPREPGVFLVPANATLSKPIRAKKGYVRCFIDEQWTYVIDHRGKLAVNTLSPLGDFFAITEIGELDAGNYLVETLATTESGEYYTYYHQDGSRDDEQDDTYRIELAKQQARTERKIQFAALDLYDKAVLMGDISQSESDKAARNVFRETWLSITNDYTDASLDINSLYPETPTAIAYFL